MDKYSSDKAILMAAFARFDLVALAVAMGTILALVLFFATAILLIRGGDDMGAHLSLLGIYLPGFEVSWAGSLIGAAYFWLIGAVLGFVIAFLWNLTHYMFVAMVVVRSMWWRMMAD